jgi:protein-S-isoprenylcysteine O-methyltransferase Ste14
LLVVALGAGFLLQWLAPISFLPPGPSRSVGPVVTATAFCLFFWAARAMIKGNASIPPNTPTNAIVVRGPYRFSRNPIYIAMLLLQIGVGIWTNGLWYLGFAVASAFLLSWGAISREERYLERKFGVEYASYKARVRRWL